MNLINLGERLRCTVQRKTKSRHKGSPCKELQAKKTPCWDRARRRIQDMEASRHKLGDGVNCSVLYAQRGPESSSKVPGQRTDGGIRHFMSQAADLPMHPCPGAGEQQGRGRSPAGSPAGSPATSSSSPFPASSHPVPLGSATVHHEDAPVWGHCCGTVPRKEEGALLKAWRDASPSPGWMEPAARCHTIRAISPPSQRFPQG